MPSITPLRADTLLKHIADNTERLHAEPSNDVVGKALRTMVGAPDTWNDPVRPGAPTHIRNSGNDLTHDIWLGRKLAQSLGPQALPDLIALADVGGIASTFVID